jgi:hypothetical protein
MTHQKKCVGEILQINPESTFLVEKYQRVKHAGHSWMLNHVIAKELALNPADTAADFLEHSAHQ